MVLLFLGKLLSVQRDCRIFATSNQIGFVIYTSSKHGLQFHTFCFVFHCGFLRVLVSVEEEHEGPEHILVGCQLFLLWVCRLEDAAFADSCHCGFLFFGNRHKSCKNREGGIMAEGFGCGAGGRRAALFQVP